MLATVDCVGVAAVFVSGVGVGIDAAEGVGVGVMMTSLSVIETSETWLIGEGIGSILRARGLVFFGVKSIVWKGPSSIVRYLNPIPSGSGSSNTRPACL